MKSYSSGLSHDFNHIAEPASIAASSITELRYAITALGIDEAHSLMDRLEELVRESLQDRS